MYIVILNFIYSIKKDINIKKEYVILTLINRITDALMQDDRIVSVTDLNTGLIKAITLLVFTVVSEYGSVSIEEEEKVNKVTVSEGKAVVNGKEYKIERI